MEELSCPPAFLDPMSGGIMSDPVIAGDGLCYNRSSIEGHLDSQRHTGASVTTSPLSGLVCARQYKHSIVMQSFLACTDFATRTKSISGLITV